MSNEAAYDALVLGTRDYIRKCGFRSVLVGLSGGIDSALVAAIAVEAVGKENVTGIGMPGPYSSDHSLDRCARTRAQSGNTLRNRVHQRRLQSHDADAESVFAGYQAETTEENLQSRLRGMTLMALSNKFGSLVLTTGNKSEIAVGYCTLYGDMCGGLAVISDVPKTMVYRSGARGQSRERRGCRPNSGKHLHASRLRPSFAPIRKIPTACRIRVLDAILAGYMERYESVAEIAAKEKLPEEMVRDIVRKVDRNEYKRQQAAPGFASPPKHSASDAAFRSHTGLQNETYRHKHSRASRIGHDAEHGSRQSAPEKVGPLPDGGFLLNSGWTIRPAGQQVPLGTFPMSAAVSGNGKYLLVMNAGYDPPTISVIDVAKKTELGRTRLPDCWLGLTIAPGGDKVYVGGGTTGKVFELSLNPATGALAPAREFAAVPNLAEKGKALIGDVELSPDAHLLYAADLYGEQHRGDQSAIGPDDRSLEDRTPALSHRGTSGWQAAPDQRLGGRGDLSARRRNRHARRESARGAASHRHALDQQARAHRRRRIELRQARLFVTASNTNNVVFVRRDERRRTRHARDHQHVAHALASPRHDAFGIGREPRGNRLFIVCSDANAVVEADISSPRSRVAGFIPTGWYPTAVRSLPNAKLVVLNGKGLGSHAKSATARIPLATGAAA